MSEGVEGVTSANALQAWAKQSIQQIAKYVPDETVYWLTEGEMPQDIGRQEETKDNFSAMRGELIKMIDQFLD